MIKACASSVTASSARANCSNSARVRDPISLHGVRWSSISTRPSTSSQERVSPLKLFMLYPRQLRLSRPLPLLSPPSRGDRPKRIDYSRSGLLIYFLFLLFFLLLLFLLIAVSK